MPIGLAWLSALAASRERLGDRPGQDTSFEVGCTLLAAGFYLVFTAFVPRPRPWVWYVLFVLMLVVAFGAYGLIFRPGSGLTWSLVVAMVALALGGYAVLRVTPKQPSGQGDSPT
jgi:uncharacterized membrane protein YczE